MFTGFLVSSVFDYQNGSKLSYWRAERGYWSRGSSRITALDFINPHDVSLLLVGSEDGAVRVWGNYAGTASTTRDPQLVTAWQALPDLTNNSKAGYNISE